jgi:maltose alpha-D-glucosyltransferase / alpha-amylase
MTDPPAVTLRLATGIISKENAPSMVSAPSVDITEEIQKQDEQTAAARSRSRRRSRQAEVLLSDDPLWYKDALIYQTHVRAFSDSNGDGIGDFAGLTSKLDYLQDLGVTAVWILPFYPSPLKDDGYDIASYTEVNPSYGTMRDVRTFVREAHKRGLRVITELVCNHTSDQHPWFQRARTAKPGSWQRDFYVWSDTAEKYQEARIIFKDFEQSNWAWDPVANAYYWHRFYSHQPDLNFENPKVHEALNRILDFWLEMGIDGLRLDAIPYLYEEEGTNCENLPQTHQYLKSLRSYVDKHFPNRMLLAEANQWPEDSVEYFGDGDECHMAFHFPVMPRLYMAVRMEDRYPIIDILDQTPPIPENAQWAMFLRNHDELTLEMVTDEERDYMYRAYAQDPAARINLGIRRRLAPLLNNNRRRIELLNGLLFSLPGTPVMYYGDEIGMGDNIFLGDRNGVRTPMQWSGDRNAGFSTANSQRLYFPVITDPEYHYSTVNVETQQANTQSLLWWMKRLIALRKRYKAFGRGTIEFLQPENRKVLAFIRQFENETILVVANLSRFVQAVELDLSTYRGQVPVEMFGRTDFPSIGDLPYFVTLGPHSFYWFSIEPGSTGGRVSTDEHAPALPRLNVAGTWENLFTASYRRRFADILPAYLHDRRWYAGKAKKIKDAHVINSVPVPYDGRQAIVLFIQVDYTEGDPDTYVLPVSFATGGRAENIEAYNAHSIVVRVNVDGEDGVLFDAMFDPAFPPVMLDAIARRRRLRGERGSISATSTRTFRGLYGDADGSREPSLIRGEQSNSSVIFGDRFILKLFRRLDEGVNPDLEIGRFLTERMDTSGFSQTAHVAGSLDYHVGTGRSEKTMTLGILQRFIPNEGDAWTYTLDTLGDYFEQMLAVRPDVPQLRLSTRALFDLAEGTTPEDVREIIGTYLQDARTLGQRTAEMHLALTSDTSDAAFKPESYSMLYQRSIYQSLRAHVTRTFTTLRKRLPSLPEDMRPDAAELLDKQSELLDRYRSIVDRRVDAQRTRFHGDYHLGQVLYTGRDFVIIDFEGEPMRPIADRRQKRSPLRDVAGMIRSFDYATWSALFDLRASGLIAADDPLGERWARYWFSWVAAEFLRAYLETASEGKFLPREREQRELLLDIFLLDKAVYELNYELNNRPDWLRIPLCGVLELLDDGASGRGQV